MTDIALIEPSISEGMAPAKRAEAFQGDKTDLGSSGAPERAKPLQTAVCGRSRRFECDDDYPRVVAMLDAGTRVIECGDGVQWAIQKCGKNARRSRQSIYYFRSKAGLLFYAHSTAPELLALPDYFAERAA
jgi:hypothetical protein